MEFGAICKSMHEKKSAKQTVIHARIEKNGEFI